MVTLKSQHIAHTMVTGVPRDSIQPQVLTMEHFTVAGVTGHSIKEDDS